MTLHIHNPEADKLAHDLSTRTGKSIDEVVVEALRMQAEQFAQNRELNEAKDATEDEILEIARRCSALPTHDMRSPDKILYDENGLPS